MITCIHRYFVLLTIVTLALATGPARGFTAETSEEDIKAAYLYNFAKFVEWPDHLFDSKTSPIVLCVLGENTFGDALKALENKRVMGRPFVVRHIRRPEQARGCQILFISDSEKAGFSDIVQSLGGKHCLTVSSIRNFARMGGMVGFVRVGNNIRFEVNLDTVNHAGLTISSRLLKIAMIVHDSK